MVSQKSTKLHDSRRISRSKLDTIVPFIAKKRLIGMKPSASVLKMKIGARSLKTKPSKNAGVKSTRETQNAGVVKQDMSPLHAISSLNSMKSLVTRSSIPLRPTSYL